MASEKEYTNRLINEKSPYLLQHAQNPVDWYPWGEEAFIKAKKEDKPIMISIGYSTCHWCHVMEEESFSNPEMAKIINEYFVPIKVDREERPDIDSIYMQAVVAITGQGGWPLTVFLATDKKPFYGGTYFAPEDKWGRPGFKTLLYSIADAWKNKRKDLLDSSEVITAALIKADTAGDKVKLDKKTLHKAFEYFLKSYDSKYGGFGSKPKFPSTHNISFLLRYWKKSKNNNILEIIENTLIRMEQGGIYDHLGGGFHRYSVDELWRVPHFEKMLYDQAVISKSYLEAYQATGKNDYAEIAKDIFNYVLREMTSPEGAFYSAFDADSAVDFKHPETKKEGAFYLWDKSEVINIIGKDKGELFSYYFGIESNGNTVSDTYFPEEFGTKNVLYKANSIEATAKQYGRKVKEIDSILQESKKMLLEVRAKRPRPHLDDKILTDWNGLMVSSLALGSRVLGEPKYEKAAERSAQFIIENLINNNGRLLHRYRDKEAAIPGMIEDYAFFILGLLDLYETTFKIQYLEAAKRLTDEMIRLFWDKKQGGFFLTGNDAETLIIRQKKLYDGAIPSGNSIAALVLIRLSRITSAREYEDKAALLLEYFSSKINSSPNAYTQALIALDFLLGPAHEIVVSGPAGSEEIVQMINLIYSKFIPSKVVVFRPDTKRDLLKTIKLIPFIEIQVPVDGKPTVYICINSVCAVPVTGLEKLKKALDEK